MLHAAPVGNARAVNPKVLLAVAAVVGFVLSAIAIFVAVSSTPSGSSEVTTTSTVPAPRP